MGKQHQKPVPKHQVLVKDSIGTVNHVNED